MEKTLDITLNELLNKLGKKKEDLVMSLNNLQQYVEAQEHGDLKYISLQRMFFLKEDFENHIEDVKTHADQLGYDISDKEAKEIIGTFERKYDSNIDENTQYDCAIEQFVKRRNKKMRYKLIDYYDVFGNEKDGYEVNDVYTRITGVEITNDATDADIINYLKSINFLSEKATTETIELTGDDFYIELTEKETGYPLGRLEREM